MATAKQICLPILMLLVLNNGCSAPVNIEPLAPMMRQLAEVTMALSAAAISLETNQSAGRDMIVNDPWLARAGLAAGTIIFYMTFVRPIRKLIVRTIRNGKR